MLLSVFHDEVWLPSCANLRECTMVGYMRARGDAISWTLSAGLRSIRSPRHDRDVDGRHAARSGAQGMGRSPHHAPQGIQVGREQCGRDHARHGTEEDGSPATRARRTADRRTAARLLGT